MTVKNERPSRSLLVYAGLLVFGAVVSVCVEGGEPLVSWWQYLQANKDIWLIFLGHTARVLAFLFLLAALAALIRAVVHWVRGRR
jgi:hypothetical protein